MSIRCITQTI